MTQCPPRLNKDTARKLAMARRNATDSDHGRRGNTDILFAQWINDIDQLLYSRVYFDANFDAYSGDYSDADSRIGAHEKNHQVLHTSESSDLMPHFPRHNINCAGFLPSKNEPGSRQLLLGLADLGYQIYCPHIPKNPACNGTNDDLPHMQWVRYHGIERRGRYNICEPVGNPIDKLYFTLILMPALLVDYQGNRLGKGGGYYDRMLAKHLSIHLSIPSLTIALIGEEEFVDRDDTRLWIVDPWDKPIDYYLQPSTGLHKCTDR